MKFNTNLLLNPWMIIGSIIIGCLLGIAFPILSLQFFLWGKLYLNLLQMCVLPILITALILSFSHLFHSNDFKAYIKQMFLLFAVGLLAASVLGILSGLIVQPGKNIPEEMKVILSHSVSNIQISTSGAPHSGIGSIYTFINEIIPLNIFNSLDQGNMLSILFFCVIFGIALGKVKSTGTVTTMHVLDSIYNALLKIVDSIMYGLPLGLCFIFAGYVAQSGASELVALGKLLILIHVALLVLAIIYSLIIWRCLGGSYVATLEALKEPLIIAFGTSSSLSAMPSMLENLHNKLKLNKDIVDFVVPVGINLNRPGSVILFTLTALFTAQLYGQTLSLEQILFVLFTAIIASIAASGVPGVAGAAVITIVMQPLGLPEAIGLALLAAIFPIVDPLLTLVNVYSNCLVSILVAKNARLAHPS